MSLSLFCREIGNPDGPPLVILHGLWGASENWLPVAEPLGRNFHVVLPDMRNHGRSFHASEFDYECLSKDLAAWIGQAMFRQKPFLAGHSAGGKTVMRLLLEQPEIADRAAIIDIAPKAYLVSSSMPHRRLLEYVLETPLQGFARRQDIHRSIRERFPDGKEAQILLKNIARSEGKYAWKINAKAFSEHLDDLLGWSVPDGLPPYSPEILFVKAACSDYLPDGIAPETRRYFPAARQIAIPCATHAIHADCPLALAKVLSDFFLCR